MNERPDDGANRVAGDERKLSLDGFTYAGLSIDAPKRWRDRRDWLGLQEVYASQPYRQLAKVYRDAGDDRAARKIAMEQFNAQLGRPDVDLPRRTRLWRWVLRYTVGHGYEPWRALYWALGLWVLGFLWAVAAARSGDMVPARVSEPVVPATTAGATPPAVAVPPQTRTVGLPDCGLRVSPCFEPALYAADLVFPIVNLGQRDNWRPSGPWKYRAIVPVLVIAGWTLTTLVVAGFTSLVRRE